MLVRTSGVFAEMVIFHIDLPMEILGCSNHSMCVLLEVLKMCTLFEYYQILNKNTFTSLPSVVIIVSKEKYAE